MLVVLAYARGFVFTNYGSLTATNHSSAVFGFFLLTRLAYEAVLIFFVLSGYLVGGKVIERLVTGTFRAPDYAMDRLVRIMLPLLPALGLTLLASIWTNQGVSVVELAGNLLSLQGVLVPPLTGNAPLWSLSYEVWFYILALAVGLLATKIAPTYVPMTCLIAVALLFTKLEIVYLFCWMVGAIAYVFPILRLSFITFTFATLLVFYGIAGLQVYSETQSASLDRYETYFVSADACRIFLSVGMAMFLKYLVQLKPATYALKSLDVMGTKLSAFSYTLYLCHYPVLLVIVTKWQIKFDEVNLLSLGVYLLLVAICLAIALVLYFLFEKHTLIIKNWIKGKAKLVTGQALPNSTRVL